MINQVLILLFITIAIIAFFKLEIGFSLVVASRLLIPPIVRINLVIVDLSFNSVLIALLYGLLIYKFVFHKNELDKFQFKNFKPFIIFLLVLFIIIIVPSELKYSYKISNLIQTIYTEFSLAFIAWFLFLNKKSIYHFNVIIGVTAIIITLYGFYCYFTLTNPYVYFLNLIYQPEFDALDFMNEVRAGFSGRIQGTMLHPLVWGGACMLLFFSQISIKRYQKIVLVVLSFFLIMNIFFSGSRSGLLAVIGGLIYVIYIYKLFIKPKFILWSVISIFGILISLYQIPELKNYKSFFESTIFIWDSDMQTENDIGGSSMEVRLDQLSGSIKMISKGTAPLFGLGQGFTRYYSQTYGSHPVLLGFESIIFMALIETGIIGLITWIVFFIGLFKLIKRTKRTTFNYYEYDLLKVLFFAYIIFIVSTGIQGTLNLFLLLFVIQLKYIRKSALSEAQTL